MLFYGFINVCEISQLLQQAESRQAGGIHAMVLLSLPCDRAALFHMTDGLCESNVNTYDASKDLKREGSLFLKKSINKHFYLCVCMCIWIGTCQYLK